VLIAELLEVLSQLSVTEDEENDMKQKVAYHTYKEDVQ
jgi:hypothetical protein